MKTQKGFTLLEVLISIAVGVIVLAAIYAAVNLTQKSTAGTERKIYAQQDARAALELMSLEIEMASFNPRPDLAGANFWVSPASCSPSPNQNYRGIQAATPFSITVEMNLNGSAAVGDNPNEVITYTYDPTNQYIIRSLDCGSGANPFLGDIVGNPRSVRVINTNNVPVFRYFNAQGTEITSAQLPASIPDIARIDITLWVETEDIDPASGTRKKLFYSTSVIPRNHVIK